MEEKKTTELNEILKNASLDDYERLKNEELPKKALTLSEYLNNYIGLYNLVTANVIKDSQLSRDYAHNILNGNRSNPTKDRVIALCVAMKMNVDEVQRALEICNAGTLYSKNERDLAIMLCINNEKHNIMYINEFLRSKNLEPLHTSREV